MSPPRPELDDRIVAIGLLTSRELALLGPTFDRAWPIEEAPEFDDLIRAIDDAERKLCVAEPADR